MELPASLLEEVRSGRVVLFLGAGASRDATLANGNPSPLGGDLGRLLAARFLGDDYKDDELSLIADLAASESSLGEVQDYIRELLVDLAPTKSHLALPTFTWRAIVTTNYDQLIEEGYRKEPSRLQRVISILSDHDKIDSALRSPETIGLLKLHGCITRTRDPELPLILTIDQYVTHRRMRNRLFTTFSEWALEYTVVYIGHSMKDSDVRAVLNEVSGDSQMRPRHYLVRPAMGDAEIRLWERKRIGVLGGTFADFIDALEGSIPSTVRRLSALVDLALPIQNHFESREAPSEQLKASLEVDLEHVHPALPLEPAQPTAFFRGFGFRWSPIAGGWDVKRKLSDTLLLDVILRAEGDRPTVSDFYAIKSEAGGGKSVLLRRLAWESAQGGLLVLMLRDHGRLSFEPVRELARLTGKRIFVFVDNAADHVWELRSFLESARKAALPVTTITAERLNTWNGECEGLEDYLSDEFRLRYMSRPEISELVTILEKFHSLGKHLEGLTVEERIEQFHERAGRQLLVALHEATAGKPLEQIILDEYNELVPLEARDIYLTVCILNRLRTPVRAGLISRVHGVNFELFQSKFLKPLENVVETSLDKATGDFYYRARHPEIAQIVFEQALRNKLDRFNSILRVVRNLNLAYSSDSESFRQLMKARSLADLFPSREDVVALYDAAAATASNEAFLWQQRALYEKGREDGNLGRAAEWLAKARTLDPRDGSITHSFAELARERALRAESPLERERLRREAQATLQPLLSHPHHSRFARHTLAKLGLDVIQDLLRGEGAPGIGLEQAMKSFEAVLSKGLQEIPDDSYLLATEADFSRVVQDDARALAALNAAHKANPREPFIAGRLARVLESKGELHEAHEILKEALASNRSDRQLNFRLGRILQKLGEADPQVLLSYFRRAFAQGDSNYEAQFWFARYSFESDDLAQRTESAQMFRALRGAHMAHAVKVEIKDTARKNGNNVTFAGTVGQMNEGFGFIHRDGLGDRIFVHRNEQAPEVWSRLAPGARVQFELGFSLSGVKAMSVRLFA